VLLGVVEVLDRDAPELTLEDAKAALGLVGNRDDALLHPDPASRPRRTGPTHDRAATVDVPVEQAVEVTMVSSWVVAG